MVDFLFFGVIEVGVQCLYYICFIVVGCIIVDVDNDLFCIMFQCL